MTRLISKSNATDERDAMGDSGDLKLYNLSWAFAEESPSTHPS